MPTINNNENYVWVFHGVDANFSSALFSTKEKAEDYIQQYKLSGTLTHYPLDISVYDWVIEKQYFSPKQEHQKTAKFIQKFSSAYLEHFHYENGKR